MVDEPTFRDKYTALANCLPLREGSTPETDERFKNYYRNLARLDQSDFVQACDRIIWEDEWFPTIARIRAVAAECSTQRVRQQQATAPAVPVVCPYCHGARWIRMGGYDPAGMQAGEEGSRVQPCPKCTDAGVYDPYQEAWIIEQEGGVPNELAPKEIDRSRTTWSVPRTAEGRVDMEAIYRQSRILRGLDPNGDDRPSGVGEWKTAGELLSVGGGA